MGKAKEMGALEVNRIERRGMNFVGGVAGLGLFVSGSGSRSWIFRARFAGKRRDMGLGGFPDVTLSQARDLARDARAKLRIGVDPIEERRAAISALVAARATAVTFARAATLYIEAHESTWRSPKHRQQWTNTLTNYANPHIGSMLVRDIEVGHIMTLLQPIWVKRTETASRLRGRVEAVLDWATARGYRTGPNPARWKGHLDKLLPAPGKLKKVDHHRALPYAEAPSFFTQLRSQAGIGAKALELVVLTAARSGEVRGATWDEFDLDQALWVVPAERMKAKREHRVPLSTQAVALLCEMAKIRMNSYVFPSAHGKMLSDMTISAVLRRMGHDAVPHGFRSTFRDWAAEQTDFPREVAEMALAHVVGNAVERAYLRTDLFDRRRLLMQTWADYLQSAKVEE